jgi:DNA polymerase-3 subunit delta'
MEPSAASAALFELPTPDAPPTADVRDHRIRLIGHDGAWRAMSSLARAGHLGQPILIVGAAGIGKRTFAHALAQALLCEGDAPDRPCGRCRACRLVAAGAHPDVAVTPSPLRIDAARALQTSLYLSPVEGRVRINILPGVDEASAGAANSLLKTLEEPPPPAVLALTAVQEGSVLATIRSRCRTVGLRPLAPTDVSEALTTHWGVDATQAELLARLSGGALGRALAWLDDDSAALNERGVWLDRLVALIEADRAGRLAVAGQLARMRDALAEGIAYWCTLFRDVLLVQHGLLEPVTHRDRMVDITRLAAAMTPSDAAGGARAAETALGQLAAHANPQLVLDVLTLALPAAQR